MLIIFALGLIFQKKCLCLTNRLSFGFNFSLRFGPTSQVSCVEAQIKTFVKENRTSTLNGNVSLLDSKIYF